MKRMFNRKKRPSNRKKGLNKVKRIFKTIKKKRIEIESPYNSSQFLIENGSSPFYDEDDEDMDISFIPNPLLLLKQCENLKIGTELNIKNFPFFLFIMFIASLILKINFPVHLSVI